MQFTSQSPVSSPAESTYDDDVDYVSVYLIWAVVGILLLMILMRARK